MSLADDLQTLDDLRRRGAITETEFAQAKRALLTATAGNSATTDQLLASQLAETRYQNELQRIDREWEMERQQYLVHGKYGRAVVPTKAMGLATAMLGGGFGLFWLMMVVSITGEAPDVGPFSLAKVAFPLFGVLFILMAIGWGIHCCRKAEAYSSALQRYHERRAELSPP